MKCSAGFMKAVLIRVLSLSLTFAVGFSVFSMTAIPDEKPELYILRAEMFYSHNEEWNCRKKPNPNLLLVKIHASRNISLNSEAIGSLERTEYLKKTLSKLFQLRSVNGIYRRDGVEIDKRVIIQSDKSISYGDLIKLVEELNAAGAAPVILDFNNEACYVGGSY